MVKLFVSALCLFCITAAFNLNGAYAYTPVDSLIDSDSSFDVTYVRLDLTVQPDTEYLSGSAELKIVSHGILAFQSIQLSLRAQLQVDSVQASGVTTTANRTGDKLFVTIPFDLPSGSAVNLIIHYHGFSTFPDRRGLIHTWQDWDPAGIPISWTSNEPFFSKTWWPCKDNPAHKIDSADLVFTCPSPYMVVSNGTLQSVVRKGSGITYHWHESYPIDHYLIAFACTQYDTISYLHRVPSGDSVRITNFVFPGSFDTMRASLKVLDTILDLYSSWFGPYPFAKEKFGMAQWHGGGMEYQSVSFCNDAEIGLLAHESAHQWFGDGVTCQSWNDCWLNEGFATYVADLYGQHQFGESAFRASIDLREQYITSEPGGTVHTPDSLLEDNTLDSRLVYGKGAAVLHMLRFVLGTANGSPDDSLFFRALREYAQGTLKYGVASTIDFEHSVEHTANRDLSWFFQQWVFGDGYPIYKIDGQLGDGFSPSLSINQTGSSPASPFFRMPIELEFIGPALDTVFSVMNDQPFQNYQFAFSSPVTTMLFDPHNWLLDGVTKPQVLRVKTVNSSESGLRIQSDTHELHISLFQNSSEPTTIRIFDNLGRAVQSYPLGQLPEGHHILAIASNLLPGAYHALVESDDQTSANIGCQRTSFIVVPQ